MSHERLLAAIPLFESLTTDDLRQLAGRLEERSFRDGQEVFHQGATGSPSLYIVEEGAIAISYGEGKGTVELATIYPGQYFGELSLFDGAPRSATARAVKASRLLALERDVFVDFISRHPDAAISIMAEMAERLRHSNELMARQVSRNINEEVEERITIGQRIADRVAAFGGSWTFIALFSLIMLLWMAVNLSQLTHFDPFPFILLNLMLSSLAALQAPVIMMSQNRQASKDKLLAQNDYEVNLKSEIEIGIVLKSQSEILARLSLMERELSRAGSDVVSRQQENDAPEL